MEPLVPRVTPTPFTSFEKFDILFFFPVHLGPPIAMSVLNDYVTNLRMYEMLWVVPQKQKRGTFWGPLQDGWVGSSGMRLVASVKHQFTGPD